MGLEETQLTNLFGGDSARSEIGDASGVEFDPNVGDVGFAGKNGKADGAHFSNWRAGKS